MIDYFIHDAVGRIALCGSNSEEMLTLVTLEPGQTLRLGTARPESHYVDDSGTAQLIPAQPSGTSRFDYTIKQWVFDSDLAATTLRTQRDRLLADSDWTQLPDVPLATKEVWATYRQALRDITSQSGFPTEVTWPQRPQLFAA